jgi:uncharacterized protein
LPSNFCGIVEKAMRPYDIHFVGLSQGPNTFRYQIDDAFFALFPDTQAKKGSCHVQLLFDKQTSHMELNFTLDGHVEIECDRCTADMHYPIHNQFQLFIKFEGGEPDANEDTDEVIFISRSESSINVAQYIYEYIHLSVPMVKNCDYLEERYKNCNKEVLKRLQIEDQEEEGSADDAIIDERWAALKKLKDKK